MQPKITEDMAIKYTKAGKTSIIDKMKALQNYIKHNNINTNEN
jgi:hypothetical protein